MHTSMQRQEDHGFRKSMRSSGEDQSVRWVSMHTLQVGDILEGSMAEVSNAGSCAEKSASSGTSTREAACCILQEDVGQVAAAAVAAVAVVHGTRQHARPVQCIECVQFIALRAV